LLIFLLSRGRILPMMQIVYFHRKEQFLKEMHGLPRPMLYVTPGPAKADGLRLLLKDSLDTDVVTISRFTSDLIEVLWPPGEGPAIKRKSELLLIFGILKNNYLPELGFEQFVQSYNLFSDLRSFTMSQQALTGIMEEQPDQIRQAVELFWKLLELTSYCDEQGAYHAVAEALRSSDAYKKLQKTYVFWGFQHLNGQQVDLLKALAIRYKVVIPIPALIKKKLKPSDWPSWLKDYSASEIELPQIPLAPRAQWLKTNSREISRTLSQIIQEGDQILLGVSKLTSSHIDLIPSSEVAFKIPHQLLRVEILALAAQLEDELSTGQSLGTFEALLKEKRLALVGKLRLHSTFKQIKALELYLEALEQIKQLTDTDVIIDRFLLKVLYDVVSLNQPRSSLSPLTPRDMSLELKDMSSLEEINYERRVLICIDERFDEIQGLGSTYSESMQKALSSLGPIKRSELDLLYRHWEFSNTLSQSGAIVLMSESVLKHSLIWKRLFSDVDLIPSPIISLKKTYVPEDRYLFSKKIFYESTLSASKMQAYQDCPRRFYHTYVEKILPDISLKEELDALAVGVISHKIMEVFFERNASKDQLQEICKEVMSQHLKKNQIHLSSFSEKRNLLVFYHRSMNGILFLEKLETILGEKIEWKMESSFSINLESEIRGKIDCLGITSKHTILLDFKSTKSAASSFTEVKNFEALQLWVYGLAAFDSDPNFQTRDLIMGYLSMDNPSESSLICFDTDLLQQIKAQKICRLQLFDLSFQDALKMARGHIIELAQRLFKDSEFIAHPRRPDSCRYCELKRVCFKGEAFQ
jgi:hypothetical protein